MLTKDEAEQLKARLRDEIYFGLEWLGTDPETLEAVIDEFTNPPITPAIAFAMLGMWEKDKPRVIECLCSTQPPFLVRVKCKPCNQEFELYPTETQHDKVVCTCGRIVETYHPPEEPC